MPQIANQDYIVVAPQYGDCINNDAAALGMLAGHIERGTIFDCLLSGGITEKYSSDVERVIGCTGVKPTNVHTYSPPDGGVVDVIIVYTPTQYEGLAAVQVACEMTDDIPTLAIDNGYLSQSQDAILLCVDGKLIAAEADGDSNLASISISNEAPAAGADWVNISWEDAQKLIGLPV